MMHIKTALMVYLFGALVLTGCASSTSAVAPTIRATAIPSPSPTAVTSNHATAGKARAAKPSAPAKPKVAGAKKGAVAINGVKRGVPAKPKVTGAKISAVAINGVKRGVPTTDHRRISQYIQYMLAAANTQ
jgi:hypothetical protein